MCILLEFHSKRPLYININILKEVSKLENIELRILSVCIFDRQIILIDDDNEVLRKIRNGIKDIIIYQDSELLD